jgi:hypothetical protein
MLNTVYVFSILTQSLKDSLFCVHWLDIVSVHYDSVYNAMILENHALLSNLLGQVYLE